MKHEHRHKKQATEFIEINSRSCEACWKYISVCTNNVIGKIDLPWHKHARIVNGSNCTGCLKYVNICESKALSKVPIIE